MPSNQYMEDIRLEDLRVLDNRFLNFSGQNSEEGRRSFAVILPDEETAEKLAKLGWPVKRTKPERPTFPDVPFLSVNVRYNDVPGRRERRGPIVRLIMCEQESDGSWTPDKRGTNLTERTIGLLDDLRILTVDAVLHPYHYNRNGNSGVTTYLRKLIVLAGKDYLDLKYADVDFGDVQEAEEMFASSFEEADKASDEELPF